MLGTGPGGLQQFRQQHPEYNDLPDADLAERLYTKFYSDLPRDQYDAKMGLSPAPESVGSSLLTTAKETAKDIGARLGQGVTGLGATFETGAAKIDKMVGADPTQSLQRAANLRARGQLLEDLVPKASGGVARFAEEAIQQTPPLLASEALLSAVTPSKLKAVLETTKAAKGATLGKRAGTAAVNTAKRAARGYGEGIAYGTVSGESPTETAKSFALLNPILGAPFEAFALARGGAKASEAAAKIEEAAKVADQPVAPHDPWLSGPDPTGTPSALGNIEEQMAQIDARAKAAEDELASLGIGTKDASKGGFAAPELVRALGRTAVGSVAGGALASQPGGMTPGEGAAAGAATFALGPLAGELGANVLGMPKAGVGVDGIKSALREYGGTIARKSDQAAAAVRSRIGEWNKIGDLASAADPAVAAASKAQHVDFVDRFETGRSATLAPEDAKLADALGHQLEQRTKELESRGILKDAIEDYFPRLFKQGEAGVASLLGKAPLSGNKGFLKQRSYEFYKDAITAGHEPVTWNPVEMALLKIRQMDKYIAFHDLKAQAVKDGLMTTFGEKVPTGMMRVEGPGQALSHYAATPEVARVLNNFTTRSGFADQGWFQGLRAASNVVNQAQLIGPFHASFVSLESVVSQTARAIEAVGHGEIGKAASAISHAPVAPVTQFRKGQRVMEEWLKPGTHGDLSEVVDWMQKSGGRAKMDAAFSSNMTRAFQQAAREGTAGGYLKAAGLALPTGAEQAMKPLMEGLVPRVKMASFADLMQDVLERNPTASKQELQIEAQKVWDSIDNRFGQLVYDNLFLNKTAKDIAHLGVRSVGWNLGTVRELGGGALDLASGQLTHRAAYFAALNTAVPLMGATMQYVMTGQAPSELKDYYFPRTGRMRPDGSPDRLSLPTYAKDLFAYATHPAKTLLHKTGPLITPAMEFYHNEDFYGVQIRSPEAPWQEQAKELAAYAGHQAIPFSVRNYQKMSEYGESTPKKIAAAVGFNAAPAEMSRTSFQNVLNEKYAGTFPSGARTKAEAAQSRKASAVTYKLRQGQMPDIKGLSPESVKRAVNRAKLTPDENKFAILPIPQQIKLWNEASPEERQKNNLAKHIFSPTLGRRLENLPEEERIRALEELTKIARAYGQKP